MSNRRSKLEALMRGMVERSFERKHGLAAAEMESWASGTEVSLEAADKGAFSRKFHGSRDWSFLDVMALQELSGSTRITDAFLADSPSNPERVLPTLQQATNLLRESGEAVAEMMALESGTGSVSKTRAELLEAREEIDKALASLDAMAACAPVPLKKGAA
ncbi:hypothetical protein [Tropicimonas sp. IMCC34011]|uniref:hypothetical protein n=1 Tax=Tropicimonas sp. IMCC34011 TaxID=2248759 RepID=UPI001300716E|nr:hypothetical protein [Tropicimonas sp. IMCC34011]